MEYKIKRHNDCLMLKLSKDITIYEIDHFRKAFKDIKKQNGENNKIIIDLEEVGFIDALALGVLTAFTQEIREKGGDVKIANMNEDIKNVFDLSRLSKIYEIHGNINDAAKSFC